MDERPVYTHVQEGHGLRAFLLALAAAFLAGGWWFVFIHPARPGGIFILVASILIITATTFSTMTIEVTPAAVRWRFGSGWPGGRIARAEIVSTDVAYPGFFGGIGIHLTMRGWLWNVAFGPAVVLRRANGRQTLLGTDDPDGLLDALRR